MNESLVLRNNVAEIRRKQGISQAELANMVGVSRNTISSIETGQYQPTAKLALLLCVALEKKFEELFYFKLLSHFNSANLKRLKYVRTRITLK